MASEPLQTCGNPIVDRRYADVWSDFYLLDTNDPIEGMDEITAWEIWADRTNPVQLVIYRPNGNSWSVVGKSDVETPESVGKNEFSLSAPIKVQEGDCIGMYHPKRGTVSFDLLRMS
ncbi:hypothetical protein PN462_03730 [Spirulina sp. CS-785/01]|uniref:hypothetical protein n=1 Tax=Spirulina sp. CS-785/01 TaxID=3021716 RepID=UPI00232E42D3|nr:hypothetical protein [Spirulina sp. CS-785/01]MDB9312201.1 hypothetical protein [Spirulina sp. CS-785/01]